MNRPMAIRLHVDAENDEALLSTLDGSATADTAPADCVTGLVEARGALLTWDVTSALPLPDAVIHDPRRALEWCGALYGEPVADAIAGLAGLPDDVGPGARPTREHAAVEHPVVEHRVALPRRETPIAADLARLALLQWLGAWWPAGFAVPPLDAHVLAAETALAAHRVDDLLDADDAVERALNAATRAPSALARLGAHPELAGDAARITDALHDLAENCGIDLEPAAPSRSARDDRHVVSTTSRADWALAAGSGGGPHTTAGGDLTGITLARGTSPVRWADVAWQSIAADAEAEWTLSQSSGALALSAWIAAVPASRSRAPDARPPLRARFGSDAVGIELELAHVGDRFSGDRRVPMSAALLPQAERVLGVWDPRMVDAPGVPETQAVRERVIAFAAARLAGADADVTFTERAALADREAGAR